MRTLILLSLLTAFACQATAQEPRYLIFNRAPWQAGDDWWDQNHPHSINAEKLRQVVDGVDAPDNEQLLIGVSFVFSILDTATATLQQCLRNLTAASEDTGIPVMAALDGTAWLNQRPDLWNWWDSNRPGYNPDNVHMVEWTGWTPDTAVKISWRNWGHQFRVPPSPNILHPRLLGEIEARLEALVPILVEWHEGLPPDKKHLFAGLKLGWELGVGYNHWYYPNGNDYVNRNPSQDPQHGLDKQVGWPCGMPKLGHNAARTAGIKTEGELTLADVSEVIRRHLAFVCKVASRVGIPRDRLFAHMGGNYAPWDKHFPFTPAINEWSYPSYSFYGVWPQDAGDLGDVLTAHGNPPWGVAEWYHAAGDNPDGWKTNLERPLSFHDCRFVNIYNWEAFYPRPAALEGARLLLGEWYEAPPPAKASVESH